MNIISSFLEHAAKNGGKIAVIDGRRKTVDFSTLAKRAESLACQWIAQGIKPGDRVLLAMPLGIDLYAAIAGLWHIGATIVLPEPALGLNGVKHAVNIAGPKAFLGTGIYKAVGAFLPAIRKIETKLAFRPRQGERVAVFNADEEHPALISFTSGSTGQPKAIVRSQGFLLAQNSCLKPLIDSHNEDERDLVAFPVFVIANLGLGITSVLPNWKLTSHHLADPDSIKAHIEGMKITRALIPPSICEKLLLISKPPKLRTIFTGGGPVFPDLLARLSDKFPETDIVSVYGSTEAEPIAHNHLYDLSLEHWQGMRTGMGLFAGKPVVDIDVKIIDDEILVTGNHVNKGYLDGRGDEENKIHIDGKIWHRTGDAGCFDEAGGLWLWGRHGVTAGEFYPFQIEAAARQWPGVRQAALIPDSNPVSLVLVGDEPERDIWQKQAKQFGRLNILHLPKVPLDKRHHSKVDYTGLQALIKAHESRL